MVSSYIVNSLYWLCISVEYIHILFSVTKNIIKISENDNTIKGNRIHIFLANFLSKLKLLRPIKYVIPFFKREFVIYWELLK